MGRLGRMGLEPAERYERERPGELIHIDVKKLGRIRGGAGHRMTGRRHYKQTRTDAEGRRRETTGSARSIATHENAPPPLTAGYIATTITADTEPSAASRPSHA